MGEIPGERRESRGRVGKAIGASVYGNSTAFGFSITITVSFGVMQHLRGSPGLPELFADGIAAAIALAGLEGAVTRGFCTVPEELPAEISMLGTAQDFLSVAAGVGAAVGVGEVLGGAVGWALAGFVASIVFVMCESAELLVAEVVQRRRGDRRGER